MPAWPAGRSRGGGLPGVCLSHLELGFNHEGLGLGGTGIVGLARLFFGPSQFSHPLEVPLDGIELAVGNEAESRSASISRRELL